MQFGLLYEMQRPFKGTSVDWNTLYKETLEQCALADKVGFDELWFVEHHFLTGFSGSPCPEVMFGALSQVTKRIRIGFGVSILPYHHPVRVAERVAMLDQLTDGRVEVGTGRSNAYEQIGLGIDPREHARDVGRVDHDAPPHLAVGRVLLRGQVLDGAHAPGAAEALPEAASAAVPGLHPDRQLRRRRREGHRRAVLRHLRHHHPGRARQALPGAGQAGHARSARPSTSSGATTSTPTAARTTGEAQELAALSLKTFFGPDKPYIRDRVNAYEELLESWGGVPDHLKADFGRWLRQSDEAHKEQAAQVGISLDSGPGAARAAFGQMDPDTLRERGIIIAGDPDSCIKGVQLYEDAGVDQVILIMQTETIPHEKVLQSIEMFGKHVIPACRAEVRAKPIPAGV